MYSYVLLSFKNVNIVNKKKRKKRKERVPPPEGQNNYIMCKKEKKCASAIIGETRNFAALFFPLTIAPTN